MKTSNQLIDQAKDLLGKLSNLSDKELVLVMNEVSGIGEAIGKLASPEKIKSLEILGNKYRVKGSSKLIYTGHILEATEVYIIHTGKDGIYKPGSMDIRLNLIGTEFEFRGGLNGFIYRSTSTVINSEHLELV